MDVALNPILQITVGDVPLGDMQSVFICMEKSVCLSRILVITVVSEWGRLDAVRGKPIIDADQLPNPGKP